MASVTEITPPSTEITLY